jgi:hypothetical protein
MGLYGLLQGWLYLYPAMEVYEYDASRGKAPLFLNSSFDDDQYSISDPTAVLPGRESYVFKNTRTNGTLSRFDMMADKEISTPLVYSVGRIILNAQYKLNSYLNIDFSFSCNG